MKALIIVDVQNDFLPGGPLAVPEGDRVVPVANRLMSAFDVVVATRDWHPPDHVSFASQHEGKKPGEFIEWQGLEQLLWPDHCIQNTHGAEFPEALDTDRIDAVFNKGMDVDLDSYSGFFDNGHRQSTGMDDFLRKRRVTEVHVMGLATDYCVKATALDARQLEFDTRLVIEGCRGVEMNEGDVARAIDEMKQAGVEVV